MASKTNYLENKLIDFRFRGQAYVPPTTLYIALMTSVSSDSLAGTEVVGGSYARVAVPATLAEWAGTQGAGTTTASTGSSGTTSNNNPITFNAPTANWGVIVGVGVYDALTGGNLTEYSALQTPKTVNSGDAAPSFPPNSISFQEDD